MRFRETKKNGRNSQNGEELGSPRTARTVLKKALQQGWPGLAGFAVLASTLVTPSPDHPSAGAIRATLDLTKYKLSFNEEFDDLSVSPWGPGTRWLAHTPWNGDFGSATFVDPSASFPFTTQNGVLRIEARKGPDGRWESGLLASADANGIGFSQQFGYFEMRAKLPPGPGVWPAFWLAGIERSSHTPEIDVLEYYGAAPGMYESVVHTWYHETPPRHYVVGNRHEVPSGKLSEEFHNYGVEVNPDWIIFYLDRVEIWRTVTPIEHHQPMLILLNLALGAGWPIEETPNPSYMYVDYVRAYKK